MYRLLFILVLSLAAITSAHAAAESSSADDPSWREYKKLLENYYSLDKQKAGHISCQASSSDPQAYIDIMHQKFGNRLTVDINPHDFFVTYDRTKGVSVNSPHIKVSVSPDAERADVEQLENSREAMETFLKGIFSQEEQIIADRFKERNMISPSLEKLKNLSLTKNGDAVVVSYDEDENKHIRTTYSGLTGRQTETSPTSNVTLTWDSQPLNGKLALAHLAIERIESSKKTNITESVSYQDLGPVFVPAHILVDVTAIEGTQQMKLPHLEIDFKDCKTSDLSP